MKNGKRTNDKSNMLTLRINDADIRMIDTIASVNGITKSTVVRTAIHDNLTSYLHLHNMTNEGDMI